MKIRFFVYTLIILAIFSCSDTKTKSEKLPLGIRKIVSSEILQTSSYTYIKGLEEKSEIWLAIRKKDIKKGEVLFFNANKALEMHKFKSKELDRVFEKILFLDKVMYSPKEDKNTKTMAKKTAFVKQNVKIDSPEGCITIAELFENKNKYAGKKVKIKALVTKFTANIMNKNWMHIQDGTEYNDKFDLTITSSLMAKPNDIHIIEGIVRVNKDFGAGYSYECIIEEASF